MDVVAFAIFIEEILTDRLIDGVDDVNAVFLATVVTLE
jgi:hypothetical protein